jgi:small subunit ribosomal protein S8
MAVHDTIGDFLTGVRNAQRASLETCTVRHSTLRIGIINILKSDGFIRDYEIIENERGQKSIVIILKYVEAEPAIVGLQRYSKPGRRLYSRYTDIPKVLGGLGIAILTTSRGVISDREARKLKVGGEVICKVW